MNVKNPFVQTLILIGAAVIVAIVANGFASRQRRLILPGKYPDALRVPKKYPPPAPLAVKPTTATTAEAAVATQTPADVATTTIAAAPPPAPTTTQAPVTATVVTSTATPVKAAPAAPVKPAADPLAAFQPHPDKPYVELGGDDVALLYANGALFLDARRTTVFEEGHIAGARSFPVWEADIDKRVEALFNERGEPSDQNKPIVIYCSGGACEDSHMLAQKLWAIQFNNVYVYKDGFPDWQKRGGAVRKGGAS
jgi:rhodanese-related sulfurtransferase